VISVGNATVHLAGALGIPTWAILPKVPGWRWMIAGCDSPWYPSVSLFRQAERGQWGPVFNEIGQALAELVQCRCGKLTTSAHTRAAAVRNPQDDRAKALCLSVPADHQHDRLTVDLDADAT